MRETRFERREIIYFFLVYVGKNTEKHHPQPTQNAQTLVIVSYIRQKLYKYEILIF